jgi:hypothetical protein
MIDQPVGTVVVGGSQAGLAAGYYLKQHDLPFVFDEVKSVLPYTASV